MNRSRSADGVAPAPRSNSASARNAIDQAGQGDFGEVRALHELLRRPYDEQPDNARYAALPPDWARHIEVSCSS